MYTRILALFMISIALIFASACSSTPKEKTSIRSVSKKPADVIYARAKNQIEKENYVAALSSLDILEAQHAYSPQAIQGQLDRIFAHYKLKETTEAINSAVSFLNSHPQHPKAAYAYYMIGLARFDQSRGTFERYLPIDLSKRDVATLKKSFNDFAKVVENFPESEYTADATQRMIYLRNSIARHEINVANYYFDREAYLAAANRGRYVVENFPKTQAVADGLAVMTQAYTLLNMKIEAQDAFTLLRNNYPQHPSIDKNGKFKLQLTPDKAQRSWINKLSLGLFDSPQPPKFDNRS